MPKTSNEIEYTVRESKRAKRVLVTVSPTSHVEVVVPIGYRLKGLTELIEGHSDWIVKQRKQFRTVNRSLKPETIDLKAMGQEWSVRYLNLGANHLSIQGYPCWVLCKARCSPCSGSRPTGVRRLSWTL